METQTGDPWELFADGCAALGLSPDAAMREQFRAYFRLLLEWNGKMNLTAVTEPAEVVRRHFLDSLTVAAYVDLSGVKTLADVGTGAGFPGVPLAIVRPELSVLLLDGLQKRLTFLDAVRQTLGLSNVRTLHLRAEEAGRRNELRGSFDAVTARAVAALPVLLEYGLPLLKVGGRMIAMKGPEPDEELKIARPALKLLGGEVEDCRKFTLPGTDYGRSLVVIRKRKPTNPAYPRASAKIKAKPLGQRPAAAPPKG